MSNLLNVHLSSQARCNSTVGLTNFSQPVTLEVADDSCLDRNTIACNPPLAAAIVVPLLTVTAILIVGGVILSWLLMKRGQKEDIP